MPSPAIASSLATGVLRQLRKKKKKKTRLRKVKIKEVERAKIKEVDLAKYQLSSDTADRGERGLPCISIGFLTLSRMAS